MKSSLLKLVAASAIVLASSAAYAQSGSGSDVSGPSAGSLAGGTFAPLPTGGAGGGTGGAASSPSAPAAIAGVVASFTSGAPVTSPATGQTIPAPAVAAVGSLITGGSPASVAAITAALNAAGAPPAAVAALAQALAGLAGLSPSAAPAAIIAAAAAFNALVQGAPASFLQNPPAAFLAIHAALVPMANSIGH